MQIVHKEHKDDIRLEFAELFSHIQITRLTVRGIYLHQNPKGVSADVKPSLSGIIN